MVDPIPIPNCVQRWLGTISPRISVRQDAFCCTQCGTAMNDPIPKSYNELEHESTKTRSCPALLERSRVGSEVGTWIVSVVVAANLVRKVGEELAAEC